MNITLPRYFIVVITSLVLIPLLFVLSSTFVYSAADHVVISEIQVGSEDADDEFVELYNPTNTDIVMENWQLRRMTSTGTVSNLVSDMDATIPAHSYFLVAPDEYDGTVTRDFAYSTSQRIAANNSVALYSHSVVNEENVFTQVDLVGMGTATVVETAAITPNPSASGSIRRINNDDTNNNSLDFEVITLSDPQNSSVSVTPTSNPTTTATPTMSPTPSPSPTVTSSPTPTLSASPSPSPTSTPRSVAKFTFPNMVCQMQVKYVRLGFWRFPLALMVCDKN